MLTLPSMLFLLAFGMVLCLSAQTVYAEDTVNNLPSVAEETSPTSVDVSTNSTVDAGQTQALAPPVKEPPADVRLEANPQQVSITSEANTELQNSAEQTPPETAETAAPASSYLVQQAQDSQNRVSGSNIVRASSAQVVNTRSIVASRSGNAITDLSSDKASYRPGQDVNLSVDFTNTTDTAQDITVYADVYYLENKIGSYKFTKNLAAGDSYAMQAGDLKIPASQFENDRGYLVKIKVVDSQNNTLGEINRAIAYETDWTKFPRYGVVGGSQDSENGVLAQDAERYRAALEKMKNMNINSYFFYDVYKSATAPFPSDDQVFEQMWTSWAPHPKIDTKVIKDIVNQLHDGGAVAMLYNMILAENANEAPVLDNAEVEYAYNANDTEFSGRKGEVMSYAPASQHYYNPKSSRWQELIAQRMGEAMKNGGFDGWQGDTIGDNQIYDYSNKDSADDSKKFWMTEGYAEFLRAIKEKLPNYYLTVNDVNGEQIQRLKDGNQDVIYNEIWPFGGGSAYLDGRSQTEYGDLKARIDQVRSETGKSLIVGAYMTGDEKEGARNDAEAGRPLQTDAVLLTTASIAAAGGYHMSLAALANSQNDDGQGIGVLQNAYYPNQALKTSSELTRKNNDYQQFITAYENILRDGIENDNAIVNTYNSDNNLLSTDIKGLNGHQVWTYGKKGNNFRTVQMINLMGINSDWKNEDGTAAKKTPDEQTNLTVRYNLGDVSMEEAQRMANQTYLVSPDDWSKSNMQKVSASVETDENGEPVLVINVPKLTLWNVIYISSAQQTPAQPNLSEETNPAEPETEVAPQTDESAPIEADQSPSGEAEVSPVEPAAEPEQSVPSEPSRPENSEALSESGTPATPEIPVLNEPSQPELPAASEQPVDSTESAPTPESGTPVGPDASTQPSAPENRDENGSMLNPTIPNESEEAQTDEAVPAASESENTPQAEQPVLGELAQPDASAASEQPVDPTESAPVAPEAQPESGTPVPPSESEPSEQPENSEETGLVPEQPESERASQDVRESTDPVQNVTEQSATGDPAQLTNQSEPGAKAEQLATPVNNSAEVQPNRPPLQPAHQAVIAPDSAADKMIDPAAPASGSDRNGDRAFADPSERPSQSGDTKNSPHTPMLPKDPAALGELGQPASPKNPEMKSSSTGEANAADPATQESSASSKQLPTTGDKTLALILAVGVVTLGVTGLFMKRERD
ncbi:glycoside hydrolase family 66 protein [Streptococcus dentasini]